MAGDKRSCGATAGEALDALTAQLTENETSTLVVRKLRPDEYFDAAQQQRLAGLMAKWRAARDQDQSLSIAEQSELDVLIDAELEGAAERASRLAGELGR